DQRADRGVLLILDDRGVIESAHQRATALKLKQEALVVDIKPQSFRSCVKIGPINEKSDFVRRRWCHQKVSRSLVLTLLARILRTGGSSRYIEFALKQKLVRQWKEWGKTTLGRKCEPHWDASPPGTPLEPQKGP